MADACFALDALPALTTRPNQIKHLRQTILNLAVRGKLVPQDLKDEPASELLKQIAAEKARLLETGEIKRDQSPSPLQTNRRTVGSSDIVELVSSENDDFSSWRLASRNTKLL